MIKLAFGIVLLMFSIFEPFNSNAFGGADSSGGGELTEDRMNPWFVENTKDVYYCIDADSAFVQDPDGLSTLIERAFNFWKRQFELNQDTVSSIRMGQQNLHRQATCDNKTDIAFQFGKTTEAQRKFLPKPRDFIGVAVRTEYNSKTLRGRGFIYISPDKGPLRFTGEGLLLDPWSRDGGVRLYYLLIHELGHVFGLPHMGLGESVLGTGFAEYLVHANNIHHRSKDLSFDRPMDAIAFDYERERIQCGYSRWDERSGLAFLGVTEDCIKIKANRRAEFELYQASSQSGPWELVGSMARHTFYSSSPAQGSFVTLYVTSENTVYPLRGLSRDRLTILGVRNSGATGTYLIHRFQQSKAVSVSFSPNEITVDGVVGGHIQPSLFFLATP